MKEFVPLLNGKEVGLSIDPVVDFNIISDNVILIENPVKYYFKKFSDGFWRELYVPKFEEFDPEEDYEIVDEDEIFDDYVIREKIEECVCAGGFSGFVPERMRKVYKQTFNGYEDISDEDGVSGIIKKEAEKAGKLKK